MMNPDAAPFIPSFIVPAPSHRRRRTYSGRTIRLLEPTAISALTCAPLVPAPPPFSSMRVPADFARLMQLPHADEFLNATHILSLVRSAAPAHAEAAPFCHECRNGPTGCPYIASIVAEALRHAAQSRLSAAMLQSGDVVWGLLQLAMVFEARQSSLRLRALAERHPRVVGLVREFLCGEGYHLPLPKVTAHEEWQELNRLLRFDWIRDNRTRVFTEISRRWKKRRTQFEQFVHFFGFRDDRPVHPVKNMITHSVKPVLIAILSGDVMATVLLARLGFFVPPDYYWDIFPFFAESLRAREGSASASSSSSSSYDVMRHLCLHFAERLQTLRGEVFNPIAPPQKPTTVNQFPPFPGAHRDMDT